MKPLYMWAGGKTKMISKYEDYPGIPKSGFDVFVEPFFGGGALTVYMSKFKPDRIVINDINTEIIGIYNAIKNDVADFTTVVDDLAQTYLPLSKEERKAFYYETRSSYIRDYTQWSKTKESGVLYFLMKTSFNGIFQSTKEANGRFATPAGLLNQTDRVYDKDNVMEWHELLQRVDIHSGDWKTCVDSVQGRAFFFMDPPYRDSFAQYEQEFPDSTHVELIDFCKTADKEGHLVFYCNRDASDSFYDDHRGDLKISYYDVTYTAGRRATDTNKKKQAKKAKEILLYSSRLTKNG
jgi:DNA adenine methylase